MLGSRLKNTVELEDKLQTLSERIFYGKNTESLLKSIALSHRRKRKLLCHRLRAASSIVVG